MVQRIKAALSYSWSSHAQSPHARSLHAQTKHAQTKTGQAPPSGLILGVGDDAAVLKPTPGKDWVISSDFFLEDIHFLSSRHPPDSVGFKALARATSDLAAMGATPKFYLLNIALPDSRTGPWLDRMLRGMKRAATSFKMFAIGGDTSTQRTIVLSITVIGEGNRRHLVTRSGAQPGDGLYVSGALGRAALGLHLVLQGLRGDRSLHPLLRPHLYPMIRIELGLWLAQNRVASAMMDISDGLSTDLGRLCLASGVGAKVFLESLPTVSIPAELTQWHALKSINPQQLALHGGDDYELLFTVPPRFQSRLGRAPGISQIRRIGTIEAGRKVLLVDGKGKASKLEPLGWDPFRK